MSQSTTKSRLGGALLLGGLAVLSGTMVARAACSKAPTITITTAAAIPSYNPFTAAPSVSAVVSIKNRGNGVCSFALSFHRASLPAVMSSGSATLSYTIKSTGGLTLFDTTAERNTAPSVTVSIAAGATTAVTIVASPGATPQIVPSGAYTDNGVLAEVFDNNGGQATVATKALPVTETVTAVCNMATPSLTSMDFSSAISTGRPNPGVSQTATVSASCTATTKVRLSGGSLQTSPLGTARPNFDNYINWTATATLGAATATLTTTGLVTAPAVTSTVKNSGTAGVVASTLTLSAIHLISSGRPVIAGVYAGTLTIQIDPSF